MQTESLVERFLVSEPGAAPLTGEKKTKQSECFLGTHHLSFFGYKKKLLLEVQSE